MPQNLSAAEHEKLDTLIQQITSLQLEESKVGFVRNSDIDAASVAAP